MRAARRPSRPGGRGDDGATATSIADARRSTKGPVPCRNEACERVLARANVRCVTIPTRQVDDARTIRALAHPVRLALLQLLVARGPLTATEAGEALGE